MLPSLKLLNIAATFFFKVVIYSLPENVLNFPNLVNLNFDTSNDTYIYTYTILSWISDIWFYPNSEFLNVTVSRSCDRAKFSWLWATFWDWYFETKNLCILTYSTVFSSWFTHNMWFLMWLLHFFLPTNFRTKVLTAQKFYF